MVIQFVLAQISSDGPYWWAYLRQFDTYYILFAAAAIATFIATPVYIRMAGRFGWVDHPTGRKRHARATATMGGLVVFGAVFTGAIITLSANNLVGEMLRASSTHVYSLMGCAAAMVVLGVIDDRVGVRPRTKLLVQSLVAVAAIVLGFRVEAITLPWLDSVVLPEAVGLLLSFFWIVGITNAINLTDGLDGLAAGICFLAASVNAVVAIWLGNHYMTVMMVLLSGSLLGFLRYNFHPARVFLGDTGSLALGMFLALASLRSAQKSHTAVLILIPLFALGYPIFDTLLAIARRGLRGQPLFASDRDHIHHRLIDRGAKPSTAAIQIYIASFVLCLVCLAAAVANHFVLGIGITFVLLMTVFSARVLGYLEWGGWSARWSGRGDMRILHAAANLARMKLRRAKSDDERLAAMAVLAAEMPCCSLELLRGGETVARREVSGNKCLTAEAGENERRFTLSSNMILRVGIDGTEPWDAERTMLFESVADEMVGEEFNAK